LGELEWGSRNDYRKHATGCILYCISLSFVPRQLSEHTSLSPPRYSNYNMASLQLDGVTMDEIMELYDLIKARKALEASQSLVITDRLAILVVVYAD
jgi:hypothetical protein